jgi:hypothetical protein
MQRVINRKLYDTEQAEQIARYEPFTDRGDFNYPNRRLKIRMYVARMSCVTIKNS